ANGPVTPGSDDEPGTVAQVVDLISEAHAAVTNALRHIGRPAEAIDDDASSRRLGAELDEMLAERASGPSGPESPPWSLPRGVPPGPKIAEPPPMYDRPPGPGFDHPLAAPESRSAAPTRSASLRHPVHRCCRSSRTRLRRRALRSVRRTRRPRRSHPARSSTHLHRRTPTPQHPHPAPALARQAREPCPAQTPPPRRSHPTPHHHTRFLGRTRISACPGTDGFSAARRVIRGARYDRHPAGRPRGRAGAAGRLDPAQPDQRVDLRVRAGARTRRTPPRRQDGGGRPGRHGGARARSGRPANPALPHPRGLPSLARTARPGRPTSSPGRKAPA